MDLVTGRVLHLRWCLGLVELLPALACFAGFPAEVQDFLGDSLEVSGAHDEQVPTGDVEEELGIDGIELGHSVYVRGPDQVYVLSAYESGDHLRSYTGPGVLTA